MRTPYRDPSPNPCSTRSARWETFTTRSVNPERARRSMRCAIRGRPAAVISGFGTRSVSGRMRSPRPAASIIAFTLVAARSSACDGRLTFVEVIKNTQQRRKFRVTRGNGARIGDETGRILEIATFAVAIVNAREDAEYLQVTLQTHPLEILIEASEIRIDRQTDALRFFPVSRGPVYDALLVPAQECIAHERYDVVADRAVHCILKIDYARIGIGHHQVARHEIAVHVDLRLRERPPDQKVDGLRETLLQRGCQRQSEMA